MAGLRQGECSRQSIEELYKVLAAFNTDNATFYAPKRQISVKNSIKMTYGRFWGTIMLQLASLNAWRIFKHIVKDVYTVLAVCVRSKVGMHKPRCFWSKCGKSLPVSKVCFCRKFGGCGNDAINVCKISVKFQPCAITRKPSCTWGIILHWKNRHFHAK